LNLVKEEAEEANEKNESTTITNQVSWPGVEYLFDLIPSTTHR